jgi:hypothetical protein
VELTEEMGWRWLLGNFRAGVVESDVGKQALGYGGARGRGRVLRGSQTHAEEGNQ